MSTTEDLEELRLNNFIQEDEYRRRLALICKEHKRDQLLCSQNDDFWGPRVLSPPPVGSSTESKEDNLPKEHPARMVPNTYDAKPEIEVIEAKSARKNIRGRSVRVFVSSTLLDMEEERKLLNTHVFPTIKKKCDEKGITFNNVDFGWGITQEDSAGGKVISLCLHEIDKCRPYMIGILGERYGWSQCSLSVPDRLLQESFRIASNDYPWVEYYSDRSVTELEMLYGALFYPHLAPSTAFYFRDPSYISQLPSHESGKMKSETVLAHKMVNNLKARIRHAAQDSSWSTRGTESFLLRENYISPAEFAELVLQDILRFIERDFPSQGTEETRVARERSIHEAAAHRLASLYVDLHSHSYMTAIEAHATTEQGWQGSGGDIRKSPKSKPLVITGNMGAGKTSLIGTWTSRHLNSNSTVVHMLILHFVELRDRSLYKIIRRILLEICAHFHWDKHVSTNPNKLPFELGEWLQMISDALPSGQRFVLVLDGLDHLEKKAHSLNWLPLTFPRNIRVILSTPDIGPDVDIFKTLKERESVILKIDPLQDREKRQIISTYLEHHSKRLSEQQVYSLANAQTTGSPLFLRVILDHLCLYSSFDALTTHLNALLKIKDPVQLYTAFLKQWETDYNTTINPSVVQDTLILIALSRSGLQEDELIGILDLHSLLIWSSFFSGASDCLLNHGGLLDFSHNYMRQAVEQRYLESKSKSELFGYRERIAKWLAQQPISKRVTWELPFQLEKLGEASRMREFLAHLPVFISLYNDEHKHDFLRYWTMTGGITEAGGMYIAALKNSPESFFETQKKAHKISTRVTMHHQLGLFLSETSDFVNAEKMLQEACTVLQKEVPEESRTLADLLHDQAHILLKMGSTQRSFEVARSTIEMRKRVKAGRIHQADSIWLLALLYKKQGDYEESLRLYDDALNIVEGKLGPSHPTVGLYLQSKADVFRKKADYDRAEALYQRALSIIQSSYGELHPSMAEILDFLGRILKKRGKYDQALPMYKKALQIVEKLYGKEHIKCAEICADLGDANRKVGALTMATEFYERALSINQTKLGSNHPEVADCLNSLALVFKLKGKLDQAEEAVRRALHIGETVWGKEHIKNAQYLNNMADILSIKAQYNEAERLYREALVINERILGSEHPEVSENLNSLGMIAKKRGQFPEAFNAYTRALGIVEKVFGSDHPKVALYLHNLGVVNRKLDNKDESWECYSRALHINIATFGEKHFIVAQNLNGLGIVEKKRGNLDQAIDYHRRALEICEESLGYDHEKVALTLNYLAEVYRKQGKYESGWGGAEDLYLRALKINQDCFPSGNHPEIAENLNGLAQVYLHQFNYEKAEEYFLKAIKMTQSLLGDTNPHSISRMKNVVNLYEMWGRVDLCTVYTEKLEELRTKNVTS